MTAVFAAATGLCLAGTLTLGSGAADASPLRSSLAEAAAGSSANSSSVSSSAAATATGLVSLAGVRPDWATDAAARGDASASGSLTTRVFLGSADASGLAAYAAAVSTPGSLSYRRFLSPTSAQSRFGPRPGAASDVSAWLRRSGLTVTAVNGEYVSATGSVSDVDRAYSVTLRQYALPGGATAVAPDRDPQIPASLKSSIATISGLTSSSLPMYAQHVTAAAASQELRARRGGGSPSGPLIPQPCSSYYGQLTDTTDPAYGGVHEPYTVCGYSASQLRSAYGANGHSGRWATVAIVDAYASPTMLSDANTWSRHNGLPTFASGQYTQTVTPGQWADVDACGGSAGWAAEESLDVEAVHAMAPSARILYYGANSCQDSDLLAALSDLITHRRADVISDSWGGPLHSSAGDEPASTVAEYEHLFQFAAILGITVNFSSGDCGANDPSTACGNAEQSSFAQTTFPASDPWVTAVGGTSAAINPHGKLAWSTSWGTDAWLLSGNGKSWESLGWIFGGGGGASADFAQPFYQRFTVPSRVADTLLTGAGSSARRVVPDLALDADPFTGLLVGQTQQLPSGATGYAEAAIGGTSLASPLLAGLEADTISERDGVPLGFINPTLYCLGTEHFGHDAVRDVTDRPSDVSTPIAEVFPPFQGQTAAIAGLGDDGPLHAADGYDDATGLGTPGAQFIEELALG